MLDLRLRYQGNGRFQAVTKRDLETADKIAVGDAVRARISQPRSLPQNSLLHALCEAAWENHQEGCPPPPDTVPTWRHMKAWLLIEAGHCDVKIFEKGEMAPDVARYLRQQFDTMAFTLNRKTGQVLMKTARRTRDLSKDDMGELIDRVMGIISSKVVPGVDPQSLFNMARAKAA